MNRRTLNLLVVALAIVTITAAAMTPFVLAADQRETSIEEHMVSDTDAVLGVLRVWHNQISQDQALIKAQAQRLDALAVIVPGEPGQQLRWKDTKWEWFTPPPTDKPVEAPGR